MVTWQERLQGKKSIGDKNFNVHKLLYFKDKHQIQNVAALRFTCVYKIQVQSFSSFWRGSNRGQNKEHIKVPALNCWGKVKLQVVLLIVLWVLRPQPVHCLEYKGLFSLTFCFSFWNLPVGSRVLSMSLNPYPLTENHWLCSDCNFMCWCLTRRKHIVDTFSWTSLRNFQDALDNPYIPCPEKDSKPFLELSPMIVATVHAILLFLGS